MRGMSSQYKRGWSDRLELIDLLTKYRDSRLAKFNFYDGIPHVCINGGDNKYKSIAAASILAKTHRDEWIENIVRDNPELEKYGLLKNKGYGTKEHLKAIKKFGITKHHRKNFRPIHNILSLSLIHISEPTRPY